MMHNVSWAETAGQDCLALSDAQPNRSQALRLRPRADADSRPAAALFDHSSLRPPVAPTGRLPCAARRCSVPS